MFVIKQATTADIPLINKLAWNVFPETYKNILSHEQIEYMMDWMYSIENLHKQMEEEGHIYYIAYEECEAAGYVSIRQEDTDLFHLEKIYVIPYYQKYHLGKQLFQQAIKGIKEIHPAPCRMELNVNRNNPALRTYGNEKSTRRRFSHWKRLLHERLYYGAGYLMSISTQTGR